MNQEIVAEGLKPCTASGTLKGYRVEARYNFPDPREINGILLGKEWREIHFPEGKPGVPISSPFEVHELALCYCVGYQAAQALRWWFHADAEAAGFGAICLETRIVEYRIKYNREYVRIAEHMQIGGEDRSNFMPDWGKKP